MKTTQAKKLSAVLRFGALSTVDFDTLIKEQKSHNPDNCLYSLKERLDEIKEAQAKKLQCWEFVPYNKDGNLEHMRQVSDNPFTLIDMIFDTFLASQL